jgi:tetratricopeptide (TPR) repeat protein
MAKPKSSEFSVPDPAAMKVETAADYMERGWLYYSHKKFDLAITDFLYVLKTDPDNVDTLYGLGLTQKASGASPQALATFEQVLKLVPNISEHQKASVLSRLVKGHINQIKTGNWNLEKEVWNYVG